MFLFYVGALFVVLVFLFNKCFHSLTLLADFQRPSLQNDDSSKGSIMECFFSLLVFVFGVMSGPGVGAGATWEA